MATATQTAIDFLPGPDFGLRDRWQAFHIANPQVYTLFKRFAFEAINAGHLHYSADAICHRVRWHTSMVTRDDHFKINNNWAPYYARQFMSDFPEHDEFFRLRKTG